MERADNLLNIVFMVVTHPIDPEKKYTKQFQDLGLLRFLSPEITIRLEGYNKSSSGTMDIPILNGYDSIGSINNLYKNINIIPEEVNAYYEKRDAIQNYLFENKYLPIEIYSVESEFPIDYKRIGEAKLEQLETTTDLFQTFKLFDGLAHSPNLRYGVAGHVITMDLNDRLILLQNDILQGKFQNQNSSEILKALCTRVNLKLEINKGIPYNENLFLSKNISPLTYSKKLFTPTSKNIGQSNYTLENKTVDENFLTNSDNSINVLTKLAKLESAIFFVKGRTLYFGGIDKNSFQTMQYTWGDNIIDSNIKINMPKPMKDRYPYYIELKSFIPGNKSAIVEIRGQKPPKASSGTTTTKAGTTGTNSNTNEFDFKKTSVSQASSYLDIGQANGSTKSGSNKIKGTTGHSDESSNTIFVYQTFLGVSKEQLAKIADSIVFALEKGAITGTLEVPIDYSITPFDCIQLRNFGTPIGKLIFNVESVTYKFTKDGLQQLLDINSSHNNIFEGDLESKKKKSGGKKGGKNGSGKGTNTGNGTVLTDGGISFEKGASLF